MSDLSHAWCRKCWQPEYCCECGDGAELVPAPINWLMRGDRKVVFDTRRTAAPALKDHKTVFV